MNDPTTSRVEPVRAQPPLLRLRGIGKHFGPVTVLHGIDLEVLPGEVHALIGENGAGKSTLMHILAGVLQPDGGRIDFNGHGALRLANPRQAQELGIATVFQERSLFAHLSIAENIFAGRQPVMAWHGIDHRRLHEETRRLLAEVGVQASPETPVGELAPDQQQMVEIAKALSLQARLVIFDEPTAALTQGETRALFAVIELLRERGMGIIYISHRLEEILCLADRVTVLKDGRHQGTKRVTETTADELIRLMVGRAVLFQRPSFSRPVSRSVPVLEVHGLRDVAGRRSHRTYLRNISFVAHAGEILGFAGLAGAGRTETALAIIGDRPRDGGEIKVNGTTVNPRTPAQALAAGIGYLSEDRKATGLFPEMSLVENMTAAGLDRFGGWWLDREGPRRFARETCARLNVACRDIDQAISQLSGGNQQKCLLARWLLVKPKVLIVDEPTRGVDVGAKSEVHAVLRQLAAQGTAVIVISSDLPEILALADRILVMRRGGIAGELEGLRASEEAVMRLASLDLPPAP